MREYYVTVNTPLTLELPVLTVTARTAFFVPYPWLPAEDDANREPGERGRENWIDAIGVPNVRFELARVVKVTAQADGVKSGTLQPVRAGLALFSPVTLPSVCEPDPRGHHKRHRHITTDANAAVVTDAIERSAGSAATVKFSYGRTESGATVFPSTAGVRRRPKSVGEACLPLFDVREGDYVLKVMVREEDRAEQQDKRSGPRTTIKDAGDYAYRDLYVWLRFDTQGRVRVADAALCKVEGDRTVSVPLTDAETWQTHGNISALTADELSLDLKPDFVRIQGVTNNNHRATALSGAWRRTVDLVVVHGTGGSQIGTALNMARSSHIGPHYEVDRDGHVVKFAYDDSVAWHAAPGQIYDRKTGRYSANVNFTSIGIENINRSNIRGGTPQEPYPRRQINSLIRLISELREAHPSVTRNRVVGHGDIGVDTVYRHRDGGNRTTSDEAQAARYANGRPIKVDAANYLHDRRLTCPGYQMPWRLLESHQLGWEVPATLPALTDGDYAGFFTFDVARLPAALRRRVANQWYLQPGDQDADAKYAGVTWGSPKIQKLLTDNRITVNFAGVIAEVQADLRAVGYFIAQLDGSLAFPGKPNDKHSTWQAIKHFYMHLFCVDREAAAPAANDPSDPDLSGSEHSPPLKFTRRAARYLKAIVANLPAVTAAAPGVTSHAETYAQVEGGMEVEDQPEHGHHDFVLTEGDTAV